MSVFVWLEESAVALWVGESLWGYPILLSLHIIGLAIVGGIFTMINFRLLGIVKGVDFQPLESLFRLAWIGLAVNAISGLALFSSQATTFIYSVPFLVKIASITIGVFIARRIFVCFRKDAGNWDSGDAVPGSSVAMLAITSLLSWTTAIVGGRLIAYL